jgi:hypothetical protein
MDVVGKAAASVWRKFGRPFRPSFYVPGSLGYTSIAVAFHGCRAPEDARPTGVGLSASEIGQSNAKLFLGHDTR